MFTISRILMAFAVSILVMGAGAQAHAFSQTLVYDITSADAGNEFGLTGADEVTLDISFNDFTAEQRGTLFSVADDGNEVLFENVVDNADLGFQFTLDMNNFVFTELDDIESGSTLSITPTYNGNELVSLDLTGLRVIVTRAPLGGSVDFPAFAGTELLFGDSNSALVIGELSQADQLPVNVYTAAPIPLPGAAWLLLGGMAGLVGLRRRA